MVTMNPQGAHSQGKINGKNKLDKGSIYKDGLELAEEWSSNPRWAGIERGYSAEDVCRLRGSVRIEHTLARLGAERLWSLLHTEPFIPALGAMTGNQAVQMVAAGLKAIYVSGWQVAADANDAGQMYPDQSLYPANSVPNLVRRINFALQRADQVHHQEGKNELHWFAPMVADAEAGFGGNLNAFEVMKSMIEAGAAGVHFEDQLSSAKKCGHMGGKVLVPYREAIQKLVAARLAADVMGVPTILVARTDAYSAYLLNTVVDDRDREFCTGQRTIEGFWEIRGGMESAISRGLAYAPYADLVWCETSKPDLDEAKQFADGIHSRYPGKRLAYNCSPSFNWKKKLDDATIAKFQRELAAMGYKYQFVTLAGFHALNLSMFELARAYAHTGMAAYSLFQAAEFSREPDGYSATSHQRFVGTGYFDDVQTVISGGEVSTAALRGSTEEEQFTRPAPPPVGSGRRRTRRTPRGLRGPSGAPLTAHDQQLEDTEESLLACDRVRRAGRPEGGGGARSSGFSLFSHDFRYRQQSPPFPTAGHWLVR